MKSNMTFLAPLLAGVVVGLSAMITFILNRLQVLQEGGQGNDVLGFDLSIAFDLFNVTAMIPPYFIQLAIGLYIIEVIFILTGALVIVDSGKDPLRKKSELAKNLRTGILLYLATAFAAILALSVLAGFALPG